VTRNAIKRGCDCSSVKIPNLQKLLCAVMAMKHVLANTDEIVYVSCFTSGNVNHTKFTNTSSSKTVVLVNAKYQQSLHSILEHD